MNKAKILFCPLPVLWTHTTLTLRSPLAINIKVLRSQESCTAGRIWRLPPSREPSFVSHLPFSQNNFVLFRVTAVFPNHFLPRALCGSLSISLPPPSHPHLSRMLSLTLCPHISLWLCLSLGSLSLLSTPLVFFCRAPLSFFTVFTYTVKPPQSHPLSLAPPPPALLPSSPVPLVYFHAALSQWAVHRNHISPQSSGEVGPGGSRRSHKEILRSFQRDDSNSGRSSIFWDSSQPPPPDPRQLIQYVESRTERCSFVNNFH